MLTADLFDVPDVPDVPGLGKLLANAAEPDEGDRQQEPAPAVPESERPCFRVYDGWTVLDTGRKLRPGVWHHTMSAPKGGGEPFPVDSWVCGPLHIEAQTYDGTGNNFGRLVRFKSTAGRWRTWAMPMELLAGDGAALRGELLAMGLALDPAGRSDLARYLQDREPKKTVRCALQVGWCGGAFVLPDAVIGPDAAGVIFQSGERGHEEHGQAGTLAGWQAEIAARAVGNPLFILGLSASFAGPLLGRTNSEGGGLHFVGDSSTGKTTILEAGCSVWGGPGYRRSWRATANGMEGAAALFNDCLLALDEISECDPREVGAIVYALGNGVGKQRASRAGNARAVTRWRAFIVSTGERTIGTTMAEGGHRTKAGQSVRLLDIPAARKHGCFDVLHDLPSGTALSDGIKRAAATHYGRAGRAFLERLTHDQRDFAGLLERIKGLSDFNGQDFGGQDKRAAGRFALLALAGEVATEYGITGWSEGEAIQAALVGFIAWRSTRGRGNDERRQIVDKLAGFMERHGDSRFSEWTADNSTVRDRAGWWRTAADGGRLYLFNSDGMREALKGFDFKRALDELEAIGAIPKATASGERAKPETIGGRKVRVYEVRADALGGGYGA
jgi:putative DNA primase/helicase